MALDGVFLHHLKKEIEGVALGARVDKIYQPNRDELILSLRSREAAGKLLLSARANSARINFTRLVPENPKEPPMLCMLLRKRLSGARLAAVRQPELERLLCLDFNAVDELGDEVTLTLAVEIMGRYSNIILVDGEGKIIDALKRVDAEMSSERLVLPGLAYRFPPAQNKLCLLTAAREEIAARVLAVPAGTELSKALLSSVQGVSPIVCREIQHLTGRGADLKICDMTPELRERLLFFLGRLAETVKNADGVPYMAVAQNKKPLDFSFLPIQQYGRAADLKRFGSFSELLDGFYGERDRIERMRVRSQDLLRVLTTASDRLSRKINAQRGDLEKCAKRDEWRVCGDLLSANLYRLQKGQASVQLEDFYRESQPVTIRLDPMLTPSQNAQKYYKEYRKAKTAEEILTVQIKQAEEDLAYLDTVFEELSRASSEKDLSEIRAELAEQGYIRARKDMKRQQASIGPMHFRSDDGFAIWVGRNNRENDYLTLKQARKTDLWFHTKNIPGSHVILSLQGREPTAAAVAQAAMLAACYSRGRGSSNVAVDYTLVRHVSKPQGAKPGMVIYVGNKTVFAAPDLQAAEKMRVR